jgi:hypothetical protein
MLSPLQQKAEDFEKRLKSNPITRFIRRHPWVTAAAVLCFLVVVTQNQKPTARVIDASIQGKARALANLEHCVIPKIQYGQYSSYDGGESVRKLLTRECDDEYYQALDTCAALGESKDSCDTKLWNATEATIRQLGK